MFLRLSDVNDAKPLSLDARCYIQYPYFREARVFVLFLQGPREVLETGLTQDNTSR